MLQENIVIPIRWNKLDSHIEGKVYTEGVKPARDEFSIRLNIVMDQWTEDARRGMKPLP